MPQGTTSATSSAGIVCLKPLSTAPAQPAAHRQDNPVVVAQLMSAFAFHIESEPPNYGIDTDDQRYAHDKGFVIHLLLPARDSSVHPRHASCTETRNIIASRLNAADDPNAF